MKQTSKLDFGGREHHRHRSDLRSLCEISVRQSPLLVGEMSGSVTPRTPDLAENPLIRCARAARRGGDSPHAASRVSARRGSAP